MGYQHYSQAKSGRCRCWPGASTSWQRVRWLGLSVLHYLTAFFFRIGRNNLALDTKNPPCKTQGATSFRCMERAATRAVQDFGADVRRVMLVQP